MSIVNLTKSLKKIKKSAQKKNTTIKNKYPCKHVLTLASSVFNRFFDFVYLKEIVTKLVYNQ